MDTNNSDDVADLLEDIDDLDEQLFGRGKKRKDKPDLSFQEDKKNDGTGNLLSNVFSEPKNAKKPSTGFGGPNDSSAESRFSHKKTPTDNFFGSLNRNTDVLSQLKQTLPKVELSQPQPQLQTQQQTNVSSSRVAQPHSNFLSFLPSEDSSKMQPQAQPADGFKNSATSQHYDRSQRLEKEIDRLNREIDEIKQSRKQGEEELIQEWKEKLNKQKKEHEETLEETSQYYRKKIEQLKEDHSRNLEDLKESYQQQLQALQSAQQQTKKNGDVLQKVEALTEHIDAISTKVSSEAERSAIEREAKIQEREHILQMKEERLAKEEQRILDDRKLVDELNLKLRTLCDDKEAALLKDKWVVTEERNKLRAEKAAFKEDQRVILDILEREKSSIEESKAKFLAEQQNLLVRVINEKSLLDDERVAFLAQRNSDITRIKDEAQKLDRKIIEVENAERLLNEARRMYEIKYQMLVELEQALTDECNELDECRKQIENAQLYQFSLQRLPFWNEVPSNFNALKPVVEVVADPYVPAAKTTTTRSGNAMTLLQLNAQQFDDHKSEQQANNREDVEIS